MIVQQIKRVRQLMDQTIYICNSNIDTHENMTLTSESVKQQIIQRLNQNNSLVPKFARDLPITEIDSGQYQNSLQRKEDKQQRKKSKIQQIECESLDQYGQSIVNDSWFAKIYHCHLRTELEGKTQMMKWVRGYMCETGVRYYIEDNQIEQDLESQQEIMTDIVQCEKSVDEQLKKKYLLAPNYTTYDINQKHRKLNQLGVSKYWHCQQYGLKIIDEKFYDSHIYNHDYNKFRNLICQLQSQSSIETQSHFFLCEDFAEMEKTKTCRRLLEIIGIDFNKSFFNGYSILDMETRDLTTNELEIINQNLKDMRHYFGDVGRVGGQLTQLHQLHRLVARLLKLNVKIKE